MNVLIILVVLSAVYGVAGWMTAHWGLKGLTCSRSFSRSTAFEGESGEMIEVVRNDRPLMIPWLRVESQISPHLQLGRQENLNVSGSRYYRSLFTLMPYQQVKRRHKVRFLHRGVYDLGSASLTVGDALAYGTTRIGHGYQAALLPELTQAVIARGVTLEMCPDSSLSYEYGLQGDSTHPLYVLYKQGARVTVNTDNLTVLDTSLEHEYELCRKMGFTNEDIVRMNNFAIEASFADAETKKALLAVQSL